MAAAVLLTLGRGSAFAWGCEGHRAVAMLAERLLPAETKEKIARLLIASPVDPAIKPYCDPVRSDPLADQATWADDERTIDPSTTGWHFIDLPRILGDNTANWRRYCPPGGCVVTAVATQFRVLTTASPPAKRADAVRFITHFIGDMHQPLHTIANGDRGGNCLPITYHGEAPQEDDKGNFTPNLHAVWDSRTIRTLMSRERLADVPALVDYVVRQRPLPSSVSAVVPTEARVISWARESNLVGRRVTYGRLPVPVPLEPASAFDIATCSANRDVGHRQLKLHERVDDEYERATIPVIVGQLRQAGIRLAASLKAAFPER